MKYFAYANVEDFTEEYPEAWIHFTLQCWEAKKFLNTLLREGNTQNTWGQDFKKDIEEAIMLVQETKLALEENKETSWV